MKRIFLVCIVALFSLPALAQHQGLPSDFTLTSAGVVCTGSAGVCNGNNISASDAGSWAFTVQAQDSENPPVLSSPTLITLTITSNCTITITPVKLSNGQVGVPYSQQLTANGTGGCVGPYSFKLPGLAISTPVASQ